MTVEDTCKRSNKSLSKWKKRASVGKGTKFDEKLVSITEKVLRQVFGEAATTSICKYLEKNYCLKLEEIPSKPDIFSRALENYLDSGAIVIERIILKNLCSNSGIRLEKIEQKTFQERLSKLKRVYGV